MISLKNINIMQSYRPKMTYMPISGHKFFDHNSAIFGPTGLYHSWDTRRQFSIDWSWEIQVIKLISIFDFWRENGYGRLKGRREFWILPQSWIIGWTFWVNCYLENVFLKFILGWTPPSNYKTVFVIYLNGKVLLWTSLTPKL